MQGKETLKKGITDGITVTMGGLMGSFKFKDAVKFTLDVPLYVSTFTHGISMRTYKKMSASQRGVIDDHCTPEWSAKTYRYWYEADQKDQVNDRKLEGHPWPPPSASELALWRKAAGPGGKMWEASGSKAGFDPAVVITGHENEMGHTIDHREPYWLSYKRKSGSERFGGDPDIGYETPLLLMTWGESYHYDKR